MESAKDGAQGLINVLRHTFATYGIPDELSSDGGLEFVAHTTRQFLHNWGVHHRHSSVTFPHSNCRAEVGVKTIKRLITGNAGKDGAINVDAFQEAILQYRNTPDPTTKISPAICVFGRPIKDLIPILPGKYHPHPTWRDSLNLREEALRHRHMLHQDKWSEHTKALSPLKIGDRVRIQSQTGHHPNKWDRTGIVIEVRQFHQYLIRIDGSGRHTLRNRKFLRKYIPVYQPSDDTTTSPKSPTDPPPTPLHTPRKDTTPSYDSNQDRYGSKHPSATNFIPPHSPHPTHHPHTSHKSCPTVTRPYINHEPHHNSTHSNPKTTEGINQGKEAPYTATIKKLSLQPPGHTYGLKTWGRGRTLNIIN